jgi:hypothetical protein
MTSLRIAGAVLAVAACVPVVASARSEPAPSAYPSCGFYWNRNTPPSAAQRRANACLLRARREDRRARLVAVRSTIEGDPIVTYVFVNGRRPVLVVVDSTRDAFGSRVWTQMRCGHISVSGGYLGYGKCRSAGRGKPGWLTPVKLKG